MSPKEYLQSLQTLRERYFRAVEDVQQIRSMMESAGAIRYDKLNVQTSPDNDQLADYVVRLEKAVSNSERLAKQYMDRFDQVREQIDMISPQLYSDILYLRYIGGYSLWKIADEMNYSFQHIRRMHGRALYEFGIVFSEVLKDATR